MAGVDLPPSAIQLAGYSLRAGATPHLVRSEIEICLISEDGSRPTDLLPVGAARGRSQVGKAHFANLPMEASSSHSQSQVCISLDGCPMVSAWGQLCHSSAAIAILDANQEK